VFDRSITRAVTALSIALCLFTVIAVNYNLLQPQSALAIFILLGLVLCFLTYPTFKWIKRPDYEETHENAARRKRETTIWTLDRSLGVLLAAASAICFLYLFVQTEPFDVFKRFWPGGVSLGNRAGVETTLDFWIGVVGVLLVLEATRRSIGWIVPVLAALFLLHAYFAPALPDWLLPHPGLSVKQIVSATFLQSLGVLGPAAGVMFKYVFLFVLFGAFLEMSGATKFIIDFSERVFGATLGGPAKVSVLGSGLMGSLSGSAVANAVTTGSFTIPMMRNAGFQPHIAGGIEAATASGGALVPPVMGAGAYMMLEFIERGPGQPQITFLEIARAALIPAVLYYFSLWMIVHFYSRRVGAKSADSAAQENRSLWEFEGVVFFGALAVLIGLLVVGFSPFKAVTGALVLILVLAAVRPKLQLDRSARVLALSCFCSLMLLHQAIGAVVGSNVLPGWMKSFLPPSWWHPNDGYLVLRQLFDSLLSSSFIGMIGLLVFGLILPGWRPAMLKAMIRSAQNGVALVAASACVGLIIGIVQSTPMATDFSAEIAKVVQSNLLVALIGIMACSLVLGMGVPSVVCYLLMATLMGSMLGEMGVDPLAAHLFIFYYGMMSMVTPPVALAAYATASLAGAKIMPTAFAAFRFSLVGFTLPFMFIYRPELLLMGKGGQPLSWADVPHVGLAVGAAALGIISLAMGITGFYRARLSWPARALAVLAAILALTPGARIGDNEVGLWVNLTGVLLFSAIVVTHRHQPTPVAATEPEH
jgi:TRAP transporter 4TM/12TM fusion protein